ncbi:MAG: mRNA surveillance protein pelota [Candidatus Altiarchaeota archaeon]
MKILKSDLRHGFVKARSENLDDLWYLSHVIMPGDLVTSVSYRRIKDKEDIGRSSGGERRPVRLKIRVEKTEFKSETGSFRISGIITEGPEDLVSVGSHHTFTVEHGTVLDIVKERWSEVDFSRLKEAERSTFRPKLLVAVIDEGEASIGLVRESQIKYYEITKTIGGKYDTAQRKSRKDEFYSEVGGLLEQLIQSDSIAKTIVAGPGFEKENFLNYLREHSPAISGNCILEHTGSSGRNGVIEVLKRDETRKVIEESASVKDIQLVEKLLENIGKDSGLGAYGLGDVESAINLGAVEALLVTDNEFVRDRERLDANMQNVKASRGLVHIVNSESEAGRQLNSLGGVGAILRFRVQ